MFDPVSSIFQGVGTLVGIDAARKSSNQQADAASQAMAQSTAATQPWRETGANALASLWEKIQAGPGDFETSPGYQWRVGEGVNALQRGAASKGKLLSGATQKGLIEYGQNMGTNEYQNWLKDWYNSLVPYGTLANMGQNAAVNQASNLYQGNIAQGNAYAAGTLGKANTINNYMNTLGEGWQTNVAPMSPNNMLSTYMGSGGGKSGGMFPNLGGDVTSSIPFAFFG